MSTQTISVAAAALGVGWGIGLVYPGSDLPSYAYYASPLELPLTLIALGLALALLFPSEKAGALTKCPATAWPAGKPTNRRDIARLDEWYSSRAHFFCASVAPNSPPTPF